MVKIERSKEIPQSLRANTAGAQYRNSDVIEQLVKDSNDKCYICESSPVSDPEVEHLLPHKNGKYPDRQNDWNNLFYACRHCNIVKNKPKYEDGIIDCCKCDPEELLCQELIEDTVRVSVLDLNDCKVQLTAELIEEVFMSDRTELRKNAAAVRLNALQLRMNMLYSNLQEYSEKEYDVFTEKSIAAMLKRTEAFAGFTRCYVRNHLSEYPKLAAYLE